MTKKTAKSKAGISQETLELQQKVNEYLTGWQRALADLENLKKRHQQEKEEYRKYCLEDFVLQLLPVIDNFQRAVEHAPESDRSASWLTGILYIQKQLFDVLKVNGLEEIEIKIGDIFDPNLAEAIDHVESIDFHPDQIISITQIGYKLNGKIIRHAKVVVAK